MIRREGASCAAARHEGPRAAQAVITRDAAFTHCVDHKRVSERTADGYTGFVYQGPDMLALQLERDEGGSTVAQYTMGLGLELMRRGGASSFYHYNHLGTTLALTGADEAVTDTYEHDAWGVLLASTGSTANPHTYVGRERYYLMPDADLYHLGFRDYAQALGKIHDGGPGAGGSERARVRDGSTIQRCRSLGDSGLHPCRPAFT